MPKLLSDTDEALLTKVVQKVLKNRVNSPNRGLIPETIGSQDIYIAKIPAAGIPGRVGSALGTAECEIFRIVEDGADWELADITLHGAIKKKETVFNIYPVSIPFSSVAPYFVIFRDKFGKWVTEAPSVVDHWIAKVPAGGIPARVGLVPGTTVAEIWYIDPGTGNLTNTGETQTIYNIYPVAVAFDPAVPYFQIDMDGFGRWLNEAPQGGAAVSLGVPFKNYSGFTIPPGGVIYCIDSEDIGGIPYIKGFRPTANFDKFYLINSQTAVANGALGFGSFLTDLVGFVAIESGTIPNELYNWGPQPNSFELAPNRLGFFPMRSATYTINGQRCGYFKQRVITELLGKWYDDLNQNSDALFQPYGMQTIAGKFGLTGGWNKILAGDFWLQLNQKVKAGTKGKIIWYANGWVMDLTHCEVSNTQETFNPGIQSQQSQDIVMPGSFSGDISPLSVSMGLSGIAI